MLVDRRAFPQDGAVGGVGRESSSSSKSEYTGVCRLTALPILVLGHWMQGKITSAQLFFSSLLPEKTIHQENNDGYSVLFPTCSIYICSETMLIIAIIASVNILSRYSFLLYVSFFFFFF